MTATETQATREATNVIRVNRKNYDRLNKIKKQMAKQSESRVTFDTILESSLDIAEMLLRGEEKFVWGDKIYDNPEVAWSLAVDHSISQRTKIEVPQVVLVIGQDDTFDLPERLK